MEELPNEVIVLVFTFLGEKDIPWVRLVSTEFNSCAETPYLYELLSKRRWNALGKADAKKSLKGLYEETGEWKRVFFSLPPLPPFSLRYSSRSTSRGYGYQSFFSCSYEVNGHGLFKFCSSSSTDTMYSDDGDYNRDRGETRLTRSQFAILKKLLKHSKLEKLNNEPLPKTTGDTSSFSWNGERYDKFPQHVETYLLSFQTKSMPQTFCFFTLEFRQKVMFRAKKKIACVTYEIILDNFSIDLKEVEFYNLCEKYPIHGSRKHHIVVSNNNKSSKNKNRRPKPPLSKRGKKKHKKKIVERNKKRNPSPNLAFRTLCFRDKVMAKFLGNPVFPSSVRGGMKKKRAGFVEYLMLVTLTFVSAKKMKRKQQMYLRMQVPKTSGARAQSRKEIVLMDDGNYFFCSGGDKVAKLKE